MTDRLTAARALQQRCANGVVNQAVAVVEEYERLLRIRADDRVPADLAYLIGQLTFAVDANARANVEVDDAWDESNRMAEARIAYDAAEWTNPALEVKP